MSALKGIRKSDGENNLIKECEMGLMCLRIIPVKKGEPASSTPTTLVVTMLRIMPPMRIWKGEGRFPLEVIFL